MLVINWKSVVFPLAGRPISAARSMNPQPTSLRVGVGYDRYATPTRLRAVCESDSRTACMRLRLAYSLYATPTRVQRVADSDSPAWQCGPATDQLQTQVQICE